MDITLSYYGKMDIKDPSKNYITNFPRDGQFTSDGYNSMMVLGNNLPMASMCYFPWNALSQFPEKTWKRWCEY